MRGGACRWARRYKWQYLDGLLPARKRARVEQHLQVCLPCRAEFALAQEAIEALRAGKPLTPDQRRVLARPRAPFAVVRVAVVLIATLVASAGVYWWQTQGETLWAPWKPTGTELRADTAAVSSGSAPSAGHASQAPNIAPIATPPSEPRTLEVAPVLSQRASQPKPPRHAASRPLPPKRAGQPPAPASSPSPPAEGTVEVYDASGALIKRQQLPRR